MSEAKKFFRDPIHNLIEFSKSEEEFLLRVIDTPEFQRLKRIRQLGLSWFTFPGAIHDRFSHSLGVCHLAGSMFDRLFFEPHVEIPVEDSSTVKVSKAQLRLLVRMSGLLHDIGHGPFSHAFEKLTKTNHEKFSIDIISNPDGNINKIISSHSDPVVSKYFVKWTCEILDGTFPIFWMKEIISSQIDVDRIDYLLRDAYFCGVQYVSFDVEWVLANARLVKITSERNRLGIAINAQKGVYSLESFILSRYHMYEQVYFHKTTRGFEQLVSQIFDRISSLLESSLETINDGFSSQLIAFLTKKELEHFIPLDDMYLISLIHYWSRSSKDIILKELCDCFVNRRHFRLIKEEDGSNPLSKDDNIRIQKVFQNSPKFGKEPIANYFSFEDNYINNPYKGGLSYI